MKVVVLDHPRIIAPARAEDVVNAPLSSCMFSGYVAAMLQSGGHSVELVDENLQGWSCDETVARLIRLAPDLLAVNLVYMWDETPRVLSMLAKVKEQWPAGHVTVFGYYPTFAFDFLLRNCAAVDSVIVGEPERTASQLASKIEAKEDWRTVHGLAFRKGDRVVRNEARPLVEDLDLLPLPMRPDRAVRESRGVSPYVLGSRGCYNECAFCYLNAFYGAGPRWRGRTPENILGELRLLHSREGLEYFYFADANFFGPGRSGQGRAARLARLIKTQLPGVGFGLECRANDVDATTLAALREAGLRDVFLGVESGCDKTLSRLRKHLRAETNARAIKILRDCGIHVSFGFIMFDPDSTLEEVRESFDFLKQNGILDNVCVTAHVLHHRSRVLLGTPMFRSVASRPDAKTDSFGGYESAYRIADERVELLAQCSEPVLRRILSTASNTMEDHGAGARQADLNDRAIDFFESCLSALERAKNGLAVGELEALARETLAKVEIRHQGCMAKDTAT